VAQRSYDVFLSYARVDDENNQFVSKLAKAMQRTFQVYMGWPLRIFLDTRDIDTAEVWEERIKVALENSTVMVAVLTPSYFHSQWCAKEWDYFLRLEEQRRHNIGLPASQALVFPVRFIALEGTLWPSPEERHRMDEAMSRQFKDLVDVSPDSPRFETLVKELVSEIARLFVRFGELAVSGQEGDPVSAGRADDRSEVTDGPRITTRMGNQEAFIRRLSEATQVTILGITNEHLSGFLEEALKRRRQRNRAFWSSIRVVFAGEQLLHLIYDELDAEFPARTQATRIRFQRAGQGRRAVASFFLLSNRPTRWSMYEYPYLLPFVGALFEMPDGSKIVQVATLRPSYRVGEYLFFEFTQEMAGELAYYQAAFEDVVEHGELQNEVTLAGVPLDSGSGFLCYGSRFRRSVMRPGRGRPSDWLPAVLVCTYWDRPGPPEPLLQIRTRKNSSHEVGVLSHVTALINQEDSGEFEAEFLLPEEAIQRAAIRTVREDLGVQRHRMELELVDQLKFHAIGHESLYFYMFRLALPRSVGGFSEASQIQPWALGDILQIHRYQVLSYLADLLGGPTRTARQAEFATRVLRQNLVLHDLPSLGEALGEHVYRQDRPQELLQDVQRLRDNSAIMHPACEGGIVLGLGRLQYREFFATLLPLYEQIGVPGAKEEVAKIRTNPAKEEALRELRALYGSETAMRDQPTEV
jgi:TIR domain